MTLCRNIALACSITLACASDALAQLQLDPIPFWVNAGHGTDTPTSGSSSQPFNTLNYALDQVWDFLHPPSGPLPGNPVEIRIMRNSAPIAPAVSGGYEVDGWAPGPGMLTGQPFPIRMIDRVSIVGWRPEHPAVITLDQNYSSTIDAVVVAASLCRLENCDIDGTNVDSSVHKFPGVLVRDEAEFDLIECHVHDWSEELSLDPGAGNTCEVEAYDCTFSGAFPIATLEGHAAVRVETPGTVTFFAQDCEFLDSHDGVEIEATFDAPHLVHIVSSRFELCENGFEAGGSGAAVMIVEDTRFVDNGPRVVGGSGGGGAVAVRGDADIDCTIRRCVFTDNKTAAFWQMSNANAVLDMGTDLDPGLNGFCFTPPTQCDDPSNFLRTCVEQRSDPGNTLHAAGNFWLPANQGASGTFPVAGYDDRFYTLGPVTAPAGGINFPPTPEGQGCGTPVAWDRNYAINAGATIDFGTALPPHTGFLPPTCTACNCP